MLYERSTVANGEDQFDALNEGHNVVSGKWQETTEYLKQFVDTAYGYFGVVSRESNSK